LLPAHAEDDARFWALAVASCARIPYV